ncbi:MAG: hypothetical protein A2Y57_03130 [Candidatus Woykebacteria bacterium RBG_13_40_7b]|uniref:UDP-N-acetylglucosamine--N-acetylmuramyl-(pentapeptide) pyrophosphoryl-undecaprenol N-acetylglucosamine transferase n=1 Tax=Candidatus Woykebacteria bacterium RBG_13_40_7b TaxID=1802594 RepID=A0A1G1WA69_9BACT|nr:MAG: hypothetical protein A2Y57_03130 [Candidatus Woykebacteria bacterium RBG_13_40_7b]
MKIVVTGGHLTPALATIEEFKKISEEEGLYLEIIYIGRSKSAEGDKAPSAESVIVPQTGVKFIPINPGRLQRKFTIYTIGALAKIPLGIIQSYLILQREKPDVILSFGSYVALPVVLAAKSLRIPILTHEQSFSLGLANRIIEKISDRIALSWNRPSLIKEGKVIFTGIPIREEILQVRKVKHKKKIIYLTGGNQGSHVINICVGEALEELLKKYYVIHQCGTLEFYNDYEMLKDKSSKLPKDLVKKYQLAKWYNTKELAEIYAKVDVVVGRSGANTVSELAFLGIPAIFIPLSWGEEQKLNAKLLENLGLAAILPQRELTPKRLLGALDFLIENLDKFNSKSKEAKKLVRKDSTRVLVQEVIKLAQNVKVKDKAD